VEHPARRIYPTFRTLPTAPEGIGFSAFLGAALGCLLLVVSPARARQAPENFRVGRNGLARILRVENGQVITEAFEARARIKTRSQEFKLTVEARGRKWLVTPAECSLEEAGSEAIGHEVIEFTWISHAPALEIRARYEADTRGPYLFKRLDVTNRDSEPVRIVEAVVEELRIEGRGVWWRGGVGQPVNLANEFFLGIEHPAALNEARGPEAALSEFPDAELQPAARWASDRAVMGAAAEPGETLADAFLRYLTTATGRGPKFRALYCDWAAHDEMGTLVKPQLTEALTFKLLDALESMKKENGIEFDDYTLDAFWFDPQGGYLTFKQPNWPRGFDPALQRIRKLGMKPGLWFDLGGGTLDLKHTPNWKGPEHPCLSDSEFAHLLGNALDYHLRRHGLTLAEFDFANLQCTETPEAPPLAVMKRNADALLKVIRNAREKNPALVIRAYNLFSLAPMMESTNFYGEAYAVSPWWLYWFDSVYSGDPRPADIPSVTSLRDSVNWYQDHVFRGFARSGMPLYDIDDSGTLVGNTSTIYYLGAEGFTDSWILNIMRGDLAPTFFGDLTLLTPNDRRFLRATLRFARDESDSLSRTEPILGVPGRGEVYGYLARGAEVSFLTVVNPGLFDQSFIVPAPRAEPETFEKLIFSNDPEAKAGAMPAASTVAATLLPGEIRVYAIGRRESVLALSLPPAPTRRFRRVEAMGDPFRGQSEAHVPITPERSGETLAVIVGYFKDGLPDRSSKQPQEVVKLQGEANGKPVEFETIPREGTDIWSGCSWAVFKHRIQPDEAGAKLHLRLVGSPPAGTTIQVTALWLEEKPVARD
jgi:hypothetical protein